eukprot:956118-Rhodomonas_salina.1
MPARLPPFSVSSGIRISTHLLADCATPTRSRVPNSGCGTYQHCHDCYIYIASPLRKVLITGPFPPCLSAPASSCVGDARRRARESEEKRRRLEGEGVAVCVCVIAAVAECGVHVVSSRVLCCVAEDVCSADACGAHR